MTGGEEVGREKKSLNLWSLKLRVQGGKVGQEEEEEEEEEEEGGKGLAGIDWYSSAIFNSF